MDNSPKTISSFILDIESMFPVGQFTSYNRAVTGEPYITFYCGCVKPQGEQGNYTNSPDEAIKIFWDKFIEYSNQFDRDRYKIYWRAKPEMKCYNEDYNGSHEWR